MALGLDFKDISTSASLAQATSSGVNSPITFGSRTILAKGANASGATTAGSTSGYFDVGTDANASAAASTGVNPMADAATGGNATSSSSPLSTLLSNPLLLGIAALGAAAVAVVLIKRKK